MFLWLFSHLGDLIFQLHFLAGISILIYWNQTQHCKHQQYVSVVNEYLHFLYLIPHNIWLNDNIEGGA